MRERQRRRSRIMRIAGGDPSKAASLPTKRVVMGVLYLVWDATFFLTQGHTLVGLAGLLLPLSWFGLAWRARASASANHAAVPSDQAGRTRPYDSADRLTDIGSS